MSRISIPADSTGVSLFRRIPQWIFKTSLISLPLARSIGVARGRVLNKRLFATASAGILLSAVAASAQGLPYMLQATSDQPSYVNQLPSRVQNADQPDPSDPQRGQSAKSRDSGPVSRLPFQDLHAAQPPSWPIANGRRPQPTEQQIDSREDNASRQRNRAVQSEVDRLYVEIMRASTPRGF